MTELARSPFSTQRSVSASTVVGAPPDAVFDMLADPRRHAEFDGSGTVRDAVTGPARLGPGAIFGMRMHWGLPYQVRNTVVEFDESRRIAWRHVGRHVWRYELEPAPGGTKITETFDYRPSLAPLFLELVRAPERNLASIRATLDRLAGIFGTPARLTGPPDQARAVTGSPGSPSRLAAFFSSW